MLANISQIKNRVHILPFVALPDFASNNLADFGKDDVARQTEKGTAMAVVTILIVARILRSMTVLKALHQSNFGNHCRGRGQSFPVWQTFEEENRPTQRGLAKLSRFDSLNYIKKRSDVAVESVLVVPPPDSAL